MIGDKEEMQEMEGGPITRLILVFGVSSLIALGMWFFSDDPDWTTILGAYIYTFCFWYGNYFFARGLYKKYTDLGDTKKRMIASILFVIVYTFLVCLLVQGLLYEFEGGLKSFLAMYLFAFFVTILISAIHGSVSYFHLHKVSIEDREAMKRAQMENELKVLSGQVNPHFLFNSLNSLMSLIPEDADLAVQFTQKLSEVYRYVLQSRNKDLTSLENELEFSYNYIFLMKIRFGDNLMINENIKKETYRYKLPVLSVQMLIENATKHNIISSTKPLEISIVTENSLLTIRNNKNPKFDELNKSGTGLENIRKRYSFYSERNIEIEDTENYFSVKMPLLEVDQYESIDH